MNPSNKERFMYVLAGVVLGICTVALILPMFVSTPAANHDAIMLAMGSVLTWGSTVVGYFFGSSKSSADKNDLLASKAAAPGTDTK